MGSPIIDALELASDEWNSAWLNKDATVVEERAAGDYLYIGPHGEMLDRSDLLGIIQSPTYLLKKGEWTEVSIRLIGTDVALLLHRFRGEGEFRGTSFVEDNRLTTLWVRIDGRWKVCHEHCSAITPESSSP